MDADRIRQALANTIREPDGVVHQSRYRGDQAVIFDAARAHADWLDGPTDEDIRAGGARLCTPDAHVWNPLPEGFDPPCISHFIEARAVLESVFQARKEAE